MSHLLIYDADLSGHHCDYLNAVVDYVESSSPLSDPLSTINFMLPAAYWQRRDDADTLQYIHRIDINPDTLKHRDSLSRHPRAMLEIELLTTVIDTHQIDELILMNLDYFQLALASPLARRLNCRISGIQLQAYTRSELVARESPWNISLWMVALRKRYRLQKMLKNVSIGRLLVPADTIAVDLLNERHASSMQAIMLPEPYLPDVNDVDEIEQIDRCALRARYSLEPGSRIILIFGRLIVRKNVENVIRAMQILDQKSNNKAVLLVVGKTSAPYQKKLRALAQENPITQSSVRFDFDFVDDAVMHALFKASDVVAMPYLKAFQSSGILFQAVRYKKPVVTANQGLINDLVQHYSLGKSVDPASPEQISEAIAQLLHTWTPSSGNQSLIDCHTAKNHAAVLLNQNVVV